MKPESVLATILSFVATILLAAGCANRMEPARQAILDIEAAVSAAGEDARRYVPEKVQDVTRQVSGLKMKFDQKDFDGVIDGAPPVLAQAQALATAAAAQKKLVMEALSADWVALAASVPGQVVALQGRVEHLSGLRKLPAGLDSADLRAAKSGLADLQLLWEQATQAQGAGDLEQAVTLAKQAKEKADGLLSALDADVR